jgi:hypothetical protein
MSVKRDGVKTIGAFSLLIARTQRRTLIAQLKM